MAGTTSGSKRVANAARWAPPVSRRKQSAPSHCYCCPLRLSAAAAADRETWQLRHIRTGDGTAKQGIWADTQGAAILAKIADGARDNVKVNWIVLGLIRSINISTA